MDPLHLAQPVPVKSLGGSLSKESERERRVRIRDQFYKTGTLNELSQKLNEAIENADRKWEARKKDPEKQRVIHQVRSRLLQVRAFIHFIKQRQEYYTLPEGIEKLRKAKVLREKESEYSAYLENPELLVEEIEVVRVAVANTKWKISSNYVKEELDVLTECSKALVDLNIKTVGVNDEIRVMGDAVKSDPIRYKKVEIDKYESEQRLLSQVRRLRHQIIAPQASEDAAPRCHSRISESALTHLRGIISSLGANQHQVKFEVYQILNALKNTLNDEKSYTSKKDKQRFYMYQITRTGKQVRLEESQVQDLLIKHTIWTAEMKARQARGYSTFRWSSSTSESLYNHDVITSIRSQEKAKDKIVSFLQGRLLHHTKEARAARQAILKLKSEAERLELYLEQCVALKAEAVAQKQVLEQEIKALEPQPTAPPAGLPVAPLQVGPEPTAPPASRAGSVAREADAYDSDSDVGSIDSDESKGEGPVVRQPPLPLVEGAAGDEVSIAGYGRGPAVAREADAYDSDSDARTIDSDESEEEVRAVRQPPLPLVEEEVGDEGRLQAKRAELFEVEETLRSIESLTRKRSEIQKVLGELNTKLVQIESKPSELGTKLRGEFSIVITRTLKEVAETAHGISGPYTDSEERVMAKVRSKVVLDQTNVNTGDINQVRQHSKVALALSDAQLAATPNPVTRKRLTEALQTCDNVEKKLRAIELSRMPEEEKKLQKNKLSKAPQAVLIQSMKDQVVEVLSHHLGEIERGVEIRDYYSCIIALREEETVIGNVGRRHHITTWEKGFQKDRLTTLDGKVKVLLQNLAIPRLQNRAILREELQRITQELLNIESLTSEQVEESDRQKAIALLKTIAKYHQKLHKSTVRILAAEAGDHDFFKVGALRSTQASPFLTVKKPADAAPAVPEAAEAKVEEVGDDGGGYGESKQDAGIFETYELRARHLGLQIHIAEAMPEDTPERRAEKVYLRTRIALELFRTLKASVEERERLVAEADGWKVNQVNPINLEDTIRIKLIPEELLRQNPRIKDIYEMILGGPLTESGVFEIKRGQRVPISMTETCLFTELTIEQMELRIKGQFTGVFRSVLGNSHTEKMRQEIVYTAYLLGLESDIPQRRGNLRTPVSVSVPTARSMARSAEYAYTFPQQGPAPSAPPSLMLLEDRKDGDEDSDDSDAWRPVPNPMPHPVPLVIPRFGMDDGDDDSDTGRPPVAPPKKGIFDRVLAKGNGKERGLTSYAASTESSRSSGYAGVAAFALTGREDTLEDYKLKWQLDRGKIDALLLREKKDKKLAKRVLHSLHTEDMSILADRTDRSDIVGRVRVVIESEINKRIAKRERESTLVQMALDKIELDASQRDFEEYQALCDRIKRATPEQLLQLRMNATQNIARFQKERAWQEENRVLLLAAQERLTTSEREAKARHQREAAQIKAKKDAEALQRRLAREAQKEVERREVIEAEARAKVEAEAHKKRTGEMAAAARARADAQKRVPFDRTQADLLSYARVGGRTKQMHASTIGKRLGGGAEDSPPAVVMVAEDDEEGSTGSYMGVEGQTDVDLDGTGVLPPKGIRQAGLNLRIPGRGAWREPQAAPVSAPAPAVMPTGEPRPKPMASQGDGRPGTAFDRSAGVRHRSKPGEGMVVEDLGIGDEDD